MAPDANPVRFADLNTQLQREVDVALRDFGHEYVSREKVFARVRRMPRVTVLRIFLDVPWNEKGDLLGRITLR